MRGFLLFALLSLCATGLGGTADFSFGRPERITLSRNFVGSVAIGDANGDGRMDLAVTEDGIEDHQLSLFIQQPDGSLAAAVKTGLPNQFGWKLPVIFTDLDADGKDEIVVGGQKLIVARYAAGVLEATVNQTARYTCAQLAAGDIDADGRMDIVCNSGLGIPSSATLFFGAGDGGFWTTTDMTTDVGSYGALPDFMGMQLTDVTGDGRPDLLLTASRISNFFVYPNNGQGGFSPATAYSHPPAPLGVWPAAIAVLDVDGDGVDEVVTASPDNQPDARLNIYRRGSNGYLALAERLPIHDSTTALLAGDIDSDGDKELLAGHFLFNSVTVVGAGSAGLNSQSRFDLPGFGNDMDPARPVGQSKTLALGDLNGDGCVDLAGATYSGATVLYGCRPFKTRVPVSDYDGDGVSDLLWRNEGTKEVYLWQWADVGAWARCILPCPRYRVPPWTVRTTGDFDGDGTSDVFWRNGDSGDNAILISALYDRELTAVTNLEWQVVGAGDFDGDDKSDLLWRNMRTGVNGIWKSGEYGTQQEIWAVTDLSWQVAGVGDFNGDGRSDILWRHAISGQAAIWLSGHFETQLPITSVTNLQWRVRGIGDFNSDGKDDIVWHRAGVGAGAIWLSADFETQQAVTTVTNLEWEIGAVGDYNGDGSSDLMWRNLRTGANAIWQSGRFEAQQSVGVLGPQISLMP